MKIVDKEVYQSVANNNLFITLDEVKDETDVDKLFKLFTNQGYEPKYFSITPYYDHTYSFPENIPFEDYHEFIDKIKELGYKKIDIISGSLLKEEDIIRVQLHENRVIVEFPLKKENNIKL